MKRKLTVLILAALILTLVVPVQTAQAKVVIGNWTITKDTIIGPGEYLHILPGATVTVQPGVNLAIDGGTIFNQGLLDNKGGLHLNGGTLNNYEYGHVLNHGLANFVNFYADSKINNLGTFENVDSGLLINSGVFTNQGVVNNKGNATISNGGDFRNLGDFDIRDSATFHNWQFFENKGDVDLSIGAGVTNYGTFLNDTSIHLSGGYLWNSGGFLNAGAMANDNGLIVAGDGAFVNAGSIVNVSEEGMGIIISENAMFDNGTFLGFSGYLENWGHMVNEGQLHNYSTIRNFGFTTNFGILIDDPGGLENDVLGTFNNYGKYITGVDNEPTPGNGGTLNNYGQMDVNGYYSQGGTLNNHGVINNNSSHTIDNGGTINNYQTIHNTLEGTIGNFADLNNYGDLINDGEIYNQGVIDNQGHVHNFGAIHNLWGGVLIGDPAIDHACRLALSAGAVLAGQLVTATVTVISPTIDSVTFHWTDPTPALRRTFDDAAAPFQDAFAPDLAGAWTVEAVCLEGLTALDTVTLTLAVDADADGDGVGNTTEDDAPNGGDGNADGTADKVQSHVASLLDAGDWRYVTLVSPAGIALAHVQTGANPSPGDAPAVDFPLGFLDFTASGLAPGGAISATLVISPPVSVDTCYQFGPTPGEPTDHWYEFLFDGTTGAEIISDTVVLHLVDGARGDGDLQANGQIVGLGAPGEVQRADLSLWKADGPDPVELGQALTYTLSIANWGYLTATNTILTDTLPAEVAFVAASSSQGTCAENDGVVICDLGGLAPYLQATVTLTTTAIIPGWIDNQAWATGDGSETDLYNNDAQASTFVQTDHDLSISLADYQDPAPLGEVITYSLLVANNGVYTATKVIVTDTLPIGVAFVSAEPSQGNCAETGGIVTCDLGDLPRRWYAEVIVVVIPASVGQVTNRAGVVGDAAEPVMLNNRDEEPTTVVEAARHTIYLPLIVRNSP